jgi:prepilin-type N-terminal cleavage/methylation domain-containing protein
MRKIQKTNAGFTIIEIILVIIVISVISTIAVRSFRDPLRTQELTSMTNTMVSKIELAKTNSMNGKNGNNFGIKFDTDGEDDFYVYFEGSSYDVDDENNEITEINNQFQLSTDIGGSEIIIFEKVSGDSSEPGDVTITISEKSNAANQRQVIIGELGEITVIK